jgi:WD40 repeat protein
MSPSQVQLWTLDADAPPITIGGTRAQIANFVFFPDSKHLLVTTAGGFGQIWDLERPTGAAATTLTVRLPGAWGAFSPDRQWLVLNDREGTHVFRTDGLSAGAQPRWRASFEATSLAFSPDSQLLAATSAGGTVRLWRLAEGGKGEALRMHQGRVHAAGFSADGRRLATVGADGTIRIWNGTPGGMSLELAGHVAHPSEAVFSPDSRRIVGRGAGGTTVWELASGTPSATLPAPTPARHPIFLDERRVATHTGQIAIWDTVSGAVTPVAGDHDGLAIVGASADRRQIALYRALHLWNAGGGATPARVEVELPSLIGAAFSPDGLRLALTSEAGLHLIDAAIRKQIGFERDARLKSVTYSRDGRSLLVGDENGNIHVFDAATLRRQDSCSAAAPPIVDLKVSPNGTRLLAMTPNATIILDIATREQVAWIEAPASRAAFSPDGRSVVANTENLRIWPVFPTTQALVDHARSVMPRALTAQQRKDFFLEMAAAESNQ